MNQAFELEDAELVSGSYRIFEMIVTGSNNELLDLEGASAEFYVAEYINSETLIISHKASIVSHKNIKCKVVGELFTEDTEILNGKYIYQFVVKSSAGLINKSRGLLTVRHGIDCPKTLSISEISEELDMIGEELDEINGVII